MGVFSCPACGGRAFKLSVDLKQAQCEDCKRPLGSWQELKARIKSNLTNNESSSRLDVEDTSKVVSFKPRPE